MLAFSVLIVALAAPGHPSYRSPHSKPAVQFEATSPDETLSDDEVRTRASSYLNTIDAPVTMGQWRALGPRAIPILEEVLRNQEELPSRRAAAMGGIAMIGGARAHDLVLQTAQSDVLPFAVRAAALQSTPQVLDSRELVQVLKPLVKGAREPAARAAAAEVLALHAPGSGCSIIRAQAEREGAADLHFSRALERCDSSRP